jgi:phosphoserine phosphatase
MTENRSQFRGLVSSDWSECLSPNGPFDPISFNYPEMASDLTRIFRQYTGNAITLRHASLQIKNLLPKPFSSDQMDAYLESSFKTYAGVPELIEWCLSRDILFVINTTNTQGYFQRVFRKGLLPEVPLIAANPLIRFPIPDNERRYVHEITEIDDKPRVTAAIAHAMNIPPKRIVVMGDSGGDGPHFRWGSEQGAFLIGSMTKPSLSNYCESNGITINNHFGVTYPAGEERDVAREMQVNFKELIDVIEAVVG